MGLPFVAYWPEPSGAQQANAAERLITPLRASSRLHAVRVAVRMFLVSDGVGDAALHVRLAHSTGAGPLAS